MLSFVVSPSSQSLMELVAPIGLVQISGTCRCNSTTFIVGRLYSFLFIVVIVFGSLSGGQDSVPAPRAALFNSFAFLVAAVCLHEIFLDGNNRAIPGDRVGGTSRPCRNRRYEFYSYAPT